MGVIMPKSGPVRAAQPPLGPGVKLEPAPAPRRGRVAEDPLCPQLAFCEQFALASLRAVR